jgi:hypothetical protein
MFLHLAGHTIGHSSWRQTADPVKQEVINQMVGHQFPFMGATRSMGDYYEGYGWFSAIALLAISVLLWTLSGTVAKTPDASIRILSILCVWEFAFGVEELLFFFAFAASFSLIAAALTGVSIIQIRRQRRA